jgi:hypothetical protein
MQTLAPKPELTAPPPVIHSSKVPSIKEIQVCYYLFTN